MAQKTQIAPAGKKKNGCLIGCLVAVIVIAAFFGGLELFRRYIIVTRMDKDAFKPYQLTSEITDIAEKITLTDTAEEKFYKLEPRFVNADNFIKFCKTIARGIEALACYPPKPYGGPFAGKTILLLQIDDPRFVDHKYSAAAHELLHSLYDQLSADEQTRVNNLLNQELAKRQDDMHLQAVLEEMNKVGKDEEDRLSELHSKFAVEYTSISPELEDYYRQYFSHRQTVVELYVKGGFGSRVRRIDELTSQSKTLNDKLVSMRNQLTAYQNAGEIDKYNSLVGQFNNQVNQYNAKAAEASKLYTEVQEFYAYFNPDYKPPEEKTQ